MGKLLPVTAIIGAFLALTGAIIKFDDGLVVLIFPLFVLLSSIPVFLEKRLAGYLAGAGIILWALLDMLYFGPYTGDGGRTYLPALPESMQVGFVVASALAPAAAFAGLRFKQIEPRWLAIINAVVLAVTWLFVVVIMDGNPDTGHFGEFNGMIAGGMFLLGASLVFQFLAMRGNS